MINEMAHGSLVSGGQVCVGEVRAEMVAVAGRSELVEEVGEEADDVLPDAGVHVDEVLDGQVAAVKGRHVRAKALHELRA